MEPQPVKYKRHDGPARYYEIEGVPELAGVLLPSVTSVLRVIHKEGLMGWSRNVALAKVRDVLRIAYSLAEVSQTLGVNAEEWADGIISAARARPDQMRDEAGNFGTRVHSLIEAYLKGEEPEVPPELGVAFNNFLAWQRQSGLDIQLFEQVVYSKRYRYAGTFDAYAIDRRTGRHVILDWKTSNAIYPEMSLQAAAYAIAYKEMWQVPITDAWIVRLGKSRPEFEAQRVRSIARAFAGFRGALDLWSTLNRGELLEVGGGN